MRFLKCILLVNILITQNARSQDLSLTGKLTGFAAGTSVIINPFLDNMDINRDDEIKLTLRNGEFKFSRHLEKPTRFSIRVRPKNLDNILEYEQCTFWAENIPMTLSGTKGQVFQSDIKGSEIQDQYFRYVKGVADLEYNIKQIADSIKTLPNISEERKSAMRIRFYATKDLVDKKHMDFIYDNPAYYCTAPELVFNITFLKDKINRDYLYDFYTKMPSSFQMNVYGKQIKTFLENGKGFTPAKLKVGDYPYNFTLKDSADHEIRFSSINSKLILLDFWGVGCGPCRVENKNYVKLYSDFKDKGFEIISVSIDYSKKILVKGMQEDNITWISLWDEKKEIYRDLYQIQALPTSYLIAGGKILAIDLRGEALRNEIEKALLEPVK